MAGVERSSVGLQSRPSPGTDMWLVLLLGLLHGFAAYDVDTDRLKGLAKARVETCGG